MSIIPLIFIIISSSSFREKGINFISKLPQAANKAALVIDFFMICESSPCSPFPESLRKHLKLTNKNSSIQLPSPLLVLFGASPGNWRNKICHQAKKLDFPSRDSVDWSVLTLFPPTYDLYSLPRRKWRIDFHPLPPFVACTFGAHESDNREHKKFLFLMSLARRGWVTTDQCL